MWGRGDRGGGGEQGGQVGGGDVRLPCNPRQDPVNSADQNLQKGTEIFALQTDMGKNNSQGARSRDWR